ncbi:hypothetical protein KC19_6G163900 [Ceratodon purpureus]|uniref:Uncharacterized protein n=1 Tax=Ceratodon purpureus TaxID=3225 RepID=A0A8T0HGK0_CERPU|nr:hypothetical protein KC19_6G163900 [Ceratodon purpureus]
MVWHQTGLQHHQAPLAMPWGLFLSFFYGFGESFGRGDQNTGWYSTGV